VAALVTQAQADGLAVHQMGGFDTTPSAPGSAWRTPSRPWSSSPSAAREAAPRTRHPVSDLLLAA